MKKLLASILTLLFMFNSAPAVFAINAPVISQITKTEEKPNHTIQIGKRD